MPRREIRLEWTDITEDAKNAALDDRNQFNKYLEEFFNEKLSDQPVFVRHWVIGV
jgi:hypothetical protein